MQIEFISEGHYKEYEDEYMSIWTFKRTFSIDNNDNQSNYEDAKNMICSDRKWLPFNQSKNYIAGWHYNTSCLEEFYNL